jgi:ectoine hydroxylase-related dioxygenase (phytanoyl-CoA dioxygenase family)
MPEYEKSRQQGDAGLGRAIAYFTEHGYTVALPLTDSQDYDLVVEIDGELKRVQVKTGTCYDRSSPVIYLAVTGGNKSGNGKSKNVADQKWDYLFGWHLKENACYFVPKNAIKAKGQLNLGSKYDEFRVS